MADAKKLIENDDPDSPEAFGIKQYFNSPVAKIATSCGFVRDDENRSDERWVKKLSNGKEAWLRTESPNREWEEPMDFKDPSGRKGGREWELLEVTPTHACKHCNQERRLNKKPCPHCKQKAGVASFNKFRSLIRANEVAMTYTLGAFMQRLATWPEGVPKDFEESTRQLVRTKILEGLGVADPDDPESMVKREVASRDWENILLRNGFKYRDMGIRGYERKFGASTMVNVGNSTKPDCVLIGVYYMYGDDRWQLDTSASVPIRDMLDYINDYVPVAQLHEARKVKVEANPVPLVPDPDDPVVSVNNFVQSKIPYVSEYIQLVNALNAHPEMEVNGKLTRHGNYVHQNSTSFEMTVDNTPEQLDVLGGDFWRVVDHVEKLIKEEVVSINHKIYRALEREHDWLQSDEAVDDAIEANDYRYNREGEFDAGRIKFDRLSPKAKERARDNFREGNLDYEWWDHIYEEWIAELEEMGWRNPEINFSGFSSQGDGASFTANGLDFRKWAAWHMSSKVIEKGHPYTDELKESVDNPDDPPREHLIHMGRPGDCPEHCSMCGAYCTLIHYNSKTGHQLPQYHICQQCDSPLTEIGLNSDEHLAESTRIPSTFSRINKTFIKVANGTIVVSPMRGGDEYWISAPGHRQQRVSIRELHGVIHQLVNLCGGPIPYMPGPRYESDDVDDPQHYIDQAVVKLKPQTGVQSKALNYRYAGSKTPLYGTVIYAITNARGVSYYVQFPHAPSFNGYYDHADLVPDARLSELGESGEDDPALFMQSLDQMPDHELIDTSNGSSMSMNCACGQWSIGSAARDEADRVAFDRMAKEEFERHIAFKRPEVDRDPGAKLRARNFITSLRPHKPQQEGYNFPDQGEQDKPEHWDDGEPPDVDDPSVVLKHEVAQRSEPIKELEVRGRRWYRRGAGGVYCKAYIYINDKLVHVTPEQYGYGDHYLTLATDWLRRNGYLDDLLPDPRDPIWYLRDKHGIKLSYGVRDVPRERDL